MTLFRRLAVLSALFVGASIVSASTVWVPAGIMVDPWQALLQKFVDAQGLVAYAAWKANAPDLKKLDDFIAVYARTGEPTANEQGAHSPDYTPGLFKRLF